MESIFAAALTRCTSYRRIPKHYRHEDLARFFAVYSDAERALKIFQTEEGQTSMTCVLGLPKSRLKALLAQGVYLYQFQELPGAIVGILDTHFAQVDRDLANKLD